MVCPMLARAWQKSRYCDIREDSPTFIVVVAIITDYICEVLLLLIIMVWTSIILCEEQNVVWVSIFFNCLLPTIG